MSNLPHQAFPKLPLIWGAPPTGPDAAGDSVIAPPAAPGGAIVNAPGSLAGSISSVAFGFNYLGGAINTAFPTANRVANQGFVTAVGIVSAELSSGLYNACSDGIICVAICKDVGAIINLLTNTNIYVVHFCPALSAHAFRSGQTFADDIAPNFGSGAKMALYVSSAGTNFATNMISCVANLRYFSLSA